MAPEESIELRSIGTNIFKTFDTLSQSPWTVDKASNTPSRRRIETEHQRLRLWAQNLGLNQIGHASLDYRVRDTSIIKASLVDLLSELQDHLEQFAFIVFGDRLPAEQRNFPVDSDEEISETECSSIGGNSFHEVDFRMNSVVERIDSLYRLAAKIRNPRYRPQRPVKDLYKHIPKGEREEFRKNQEHIETVRVAFVQKEYLLQSVATEQLEALQCSLEDLLKQYGSPTHWLIRRIGVANARRLQQLKYWNTHAKILARDIPLESPRGKQDASQHTTQDAKHDASGGAPTLSYTRELREFSQTTATKLDKRMLHMPSDEKSVISRYSGVSTVVNTQGQKMIWPPAPSHLPGRKDFFCPFCKVICPESYQLRKDKWRTHLIHDLQSYQCTYEHCSDARRLYGDQQEWIDHENQHRHVWCCQTHNTEFETLPLYQQHLKDEHVSEELPIQVASIPADASSEPHRDCPLCPTMFDSVDQMRKHVRHHLLRLAMLALRVADEDDTASTGSDQSANSNRVVERLGRRDSIAKDFGDQDLTSWEFPTESLQTPSIEGMSPHSSESSVLPTGPEPHPVSTKLHRKLVGSSENDLFLPKNDMRDILGIRTVNDILYSVRMNAGYKGDPVDAERDICPEGNKRKRIKILAILMLIKEPFYIATFVRKGIWDDDLPLGRSTHGQLFEGWGASSIDAFSRWQYSVLAPVIDFSTTKHRTFDQNCHMPFLEVLNLEALESYGKIYKIRIHESHQIWKPPFRSSKYYLVKRFSAFSPSKFHDERKALENFSRPNNFHNHLMELLLSYNLGPDQYMIFPWADCDLKEFCSQNETRHFEPDDLIWIIRQCHGLADGLCEVHKHYGTDDTIGENTRTKTLGRHGDINPNSILFFGPKDQRGRLVLSNFTLTTLDAPDIDNAYPDTLWVHTYYPPEGRYAVQVTQEYDIWTLGCIFLELISWHLIGCNAADSFAEARSGDDDEQYGILSDKFFNRDDTLRHQETNAKVKDSVRQWIDDLIQHPNASPASRAFTSFITNRMIVIGPSDRCSMKLAREGLQEILDKSQDANGTDFFLPTPLSPSSPPITEGKRYPPPFTEDKTYGKEPVEPFPEPILFSGALSNSRSYLNEPTRKPEARPDTRSEVYRLLKGNEIRVEFDPEEDRQRREEPKELRKEEHKLELIEGRLEEKRAEEQTELPRDHHRVEQSEAPSTQAPIDPYQFQGAEIETVLLEGNSQPQARDNDPSVLPEASFVQEVRPVKGVGSGGSEHDRQQRSQRSGGSTGEMQETASEEVHISAGMTGSGQKRGTSRLARLGRLIPSKRIRKVLRS